MIVGGVKRKEEQKEFTIAGGARRSESRQLKST